MSFVGRTECTHSVRRNRVDAVVEEEIVPARPAGVGNEPPRAPQGRAAAGAATPGSRRPPLPTGLQPLRALAHRLSPEYAC